MLRGRLLICAVLAIAPCTSGLCEDVDVPAVAIPLPDGPSTLPPPGFVGFCIRFPQACTKDGSTAKLALNDRTASTLARVNDYVNDAITYETDEEHYGAVNQWTLNAIGGRGDCEDYSVSKREALRAAGLPDDALRIAIVRTPRGEFHAVLTVDTDRGVLVLDNITSEIHAWTDTPYTWLKRQSADDPLDWVMLNPAGR
jgi:predicted transglutaminase-like cysteine proteinase